MNIIGINKRDLFELAYKIIFRERRYTMTIKKISKRVSITCKCKSSC